jgi:hypothetical protein
MAFQSPKNNPDVKGVSFGADGPANSTPDQIRQILNQARFAVLGSFPVAGTSLVVDTARTPTGTVSGLRIPGLRIGQNESPATSDLLNGVTLDGVDPVTLMPNAPMSPGLSEYSRKMAEQERLIETELAAQRALIDGGGPLVVPRPPRLRRAAEPEAPPVPPRLPAPVVKFEAVKRRIILPEE